MFDRTATKVSNYVKMLEATKYGDYGPGAADWKKREKAATKLGELGDGRAIEPLVKYAERHHSTVALNAIVRIGLQNDENREQARQALTKLRDWSPALMGHHRRTYRGNEPPSLEAVWLNNIEDKLKKLW